MAKRRAPGTGSINQLPSGSWWALVTVDGRRISHTSKTQKEADSWIKEITSQVEKGHTFEAIHTILGAFLDEWLKIKKTRVRPATIEQYERLARIYIKPGIGEIVIKDLNAARIQAFYGQLQEKGTGKRTIEIVHTVLHGCL